MTDIANPFVFSRGTLLEFVQLIVRSATANEMAQRAVYTRVIHKLSASYGIKLAIGYGDTARSDIDSLDLVVKLERTDTFKHLATFAVTIRHRLTLVTRFTLDFKDAWSYERLLALLDIAVPSTGRLPSMQSMNLTLIAACVLGAEASVVPESGEPINATLAERIETKVAVLARKGEVLSARAVPPEMMYARECAPSDDLVEELLASKHGCPSFLFGMCRRHNVLLFCESKMAK